MLILGLTLLSILTMAQNYPAVRERFDQYLNDKKTPGLQYVVIKNGEIIFEYNGGYTDLEKQIPVTNQSLFRAYSITKTFTSLAIMQLVEKGNLNLDDPASKYLDQYPYQHEVTIRQLLSHTAGMPNPLPKWVHYEKDHENFDRKGAQDFIVTKHNKLKSIPGTKASYSNVGYILLGMIIEKVSGLNYEDYIERNIFGKLDTGNHYAGFIIPGSDNFATAYNSLNPLMVWGYKRMFGKELIGRKNSNWISLNKFYLNVSPFGGLITSSEVLAKFACNLYFDENDLLSDTFKKELFTPVRLNSGKINQGRMYGKKISIGLAWMRSEIDGKTYFTHPGNAPGYSCDMRIYPDEKMVTVVMMNRSPKTSDLKFLDGFDCYFFGSVAE